MVARSSTHVLAGWRGGWHVRREAVVLMCLADLAALKSISPMVGARRRRLEEQPEPVMCMGAWSACTQACEMVPGNRFGYPPRLCTEQADAPEQPAVDCAKGVDDCECPPGSFYAIACEQCDPGRYDHDRNPNTRCADCPPGMYAPGGEGMLQCTLCEEGKYAGSAGADACNDCLPGQAAGEGARVCAPIYGSRDSGFSHASHAFLCADGENARGVRIAQKFVPNVLAGEYDVQLPRGYRVGCDGDENTTSAAYTECAREIVCEFPPLGDDTEIPATGLDCEWTGVRCANGFEGMFSFGCGSNKTVDELIGTTPDLTPLGCDEIPPEPEPDNPEDDYVYCDPRAYPPGENPKDIAEDEDEDEQVKVEGPCPGGLECPDCCKTDAIAERAGTWELDRSISQPQCYDADIRNKIASTNDRVIEFITTPIPAGGDYTYKSPFACVCPPDPGPIPPPQIPIGAVIVFFACCGCFAAIIRKLIKIQKVHTASRLKARCVAIPLHHAADRTRLIGRGYYLYP